MSDGAFWAGLLALGAFHGLNPAMGWLFAVAIGLQEQRLRALLLALLPIALGHALAIALVLGALVLGAQWVGESLIRRIAALVLLGFGLWRLLSQRHFSWVGMRVGNADLLLWSFLMATAHGAGLMLAPLVMEYEPLTTLPQGETWLLSTLVVVVHSCGHLVISGLIAWIVFAKLGLALLRQAWFNLDLLWALVLMAAGGWLLITVHG